MIAFSTEFPVRPSDNRSAFVSEVLAWLRGMQNQTVLSSESEAELDDANVHVRSGTGEELRMRELQSMDGWSAVGARHDLPDDMGRIWRTECVLKRGAAEDGQDLVRLRTQCMARVSGARLERPLKPYLIKALLKNGWGGKDGVLAVSDRPLWLESTDHGISFAKSITLGEATKWLPTIYISSTAKSSWILSKRDIEKLAFDLGGIAHIAVEPNREFSVALRDKTNGQNVYGGTLGLLVPNQGVVRRYYLGWQLQDKNAIISAVKDAAIDLRSNMPTSGWDWSELQENALRAQRNRERNQLSAVENEQIYVEEIENLQDRIRQLEQQLIKEPVDSIGTDQSEFSTENLVRLVGPEFYPGEISDRLRLAAKTTLSVADQVGLDARSIAILQRIVERLTGSPALQELIQDLSRATKDPKRVAKELKALLGRHGYVEKSKNKHLRLEAHSDYVGLEPITVSKTPSEIRGLKNLCSQIERTLGLNKLCD